MADQFRNAVSNLQVDQQQLYREEIYTDLKVATIHRMVPVKADGTDDPARTCRFSAQTQLVTPMGAIPVQAEIEADTLQVALERFPEAMQAAVDEMMNEVQKRQMAEAGRVVTPGEAAGQGGLILPR